MLRHVAWPNPPPGAFAAHTPAIPLCAPAAASVDETLVAPAPGFPVYLVEPDRHLRMARTRALTDAGFPTRPFADPDDFTSTLSELAPGCVVLDVAAAAAVAQAQREEGREDALRFPTILVFSELNSADAIAAVRLGAVDLLHRCEPLPELLAALSRAEQKVADFRMRVAASRARAALDALTPREREVMACIMHGLSSKKMARILGISPRTVEMHRASIHRRLGVSSLGELLALGWHARAGGTN